MSDLELTCVLPGCDYDMTKDEETTKAVLLYLLALSLDVDRGQVRHISVSVHRKPDE
jgi:nucleoside-specific outer membrane channel protein Tsx